MDKIRREIIDILQAEGERTGHYITPWTISTRILRQKTNCKLYARLRHLRTKAQRQGASATEVKRISILDVLNKSEMQLMYYIVKERYKAK